MLNGKETIIYLIVGLIKKMSEYYLTANVKIKLYLYNYATKVDFKNAIGVDT